MNRVDELLSRIVKALEVIQELQSKLNDAELQLASAERTIARLLKEKDGGKEVRYVKLFKTKGLYDKYTEDADYQKLNIDLSDYTYINDQLC